MGSKKCFNAKKFFFLFFPEYLPLILGVPINVGVPNPNFRGNPPSTTRANPDDDGETLGYYFKGCYSAMKDQVEENQDLVVGLAISVVVVVMFLNIIFSFSLCMTVKSKKV